VADGNDVISIPVEKLKALWWVGGAIVSIAVALITTTLYINDLLSKLSRLEKQVAR
jgi:hypothetical protein